MTRSRLALALLTLTAFGCQSDLIGWRTKLAAANASRLVGVWQIQLRADHGTSDSGQLRAVNGQIALTLNGERMDHPGFGEPPMLFGTYDVDFAPVGLPVANYAGFPNVVVRMRDGSVDLEFAAGSTLPIEFHGAFAGDSVVGRWTAQSRAGSGGTGEFVLRRR